MAITRDKKSKIVNDITGLLDSSRLTVVAKYAGTSVKSMQQLRNDAKNNGTTIRVIKNRLVKKALENSEIHKELDISFLSGQLLYAFNSDDEVAPAQSLASFAKTEPQLEFVGGITADGQVLSADDVKALAALPSKTQLQAQLAGTIAAPLSGFVNVLSGNVRSVLNVLNSRMNQLS